jgi:hypothetical protein
MKSSVKFLCDQEGRKFFAQLLPDEYEALLDAAREGALLRSRVKNAKSMLSSALAAGYAPIEAGGSKNDHSAETAVLSETVRPDKKGKPSVAESVIQSPDIPVEKTPPPAASAAAGKPDSSFRREPSVSMPPVLAKFLEEQDPSQKSLRLIEVCVLKLSIFCEKRITLTLHKPYICLWDFDEWKTFAFGEVINESLYLSIERSLVPNASAADIWIPPCGLYKKPLVRLKVDAVTDALLIHLKNALSCQLEEAAA